MREAFTEWLYAAVGHPQRLNIAINAQLGYLTRIAYVLACMAFFALLSAPSRAFALRSFAPLAALRPARLISVLATASVLVTVAILVSQVNWTHLPLGHLLAMLAGTALMMVSLRERPTMEIVAPFLAAPFLATLLICMPYASPLRLLCFALLLAGASLVIVSVLEGNARAPLSEHVHRWAYRGLLAILALVYVFLCLNVSNWSGLEYQMAIHWGVFVSGAQSLLLQLAPFHDVPLQYGLGPSLALYGFCKLRGDCWLGLYALLALLYPFYLLLLCRACRATWPDASHVFHLLMVLLAAAVLFCWNSAGPVHALLVPSTGPLRFFPLLGLLTLLQSGRAAAARLLFAFTIWWSFDMTIMCAVCLFAFECVHDGFIKAALRMAVVMLISGVLGCTMLWLTWGYMPDPNVYFEYLFHMPGNLDPEFFGTTWIYFIALGIAVATVVAPQAREERAASAAVAAAALGALLYYLSRSISVNMDNVMPFLLLLVLRAGWLYRDRGFWRLSTATFLGMLLAGTSIASWTGRLGFNHDVNTLAQDDRAVEQALVAPLDTARFGILMVLENQAPPRVPRPRWGLIDSWGEWFPIPAARQQFYIARTIGKMPDRRLGGCMIVYHEYVSLVEGYAATFNVVSRRSNGDYRLIGLVRKGASLPQGTDPCAAMS